MNKILIQQKREIDENDGNRKWKQIKLTQKVDKQQYKQIGRLVSKELIDKW
jgi:hypothetical protein